MYLKLHNCSNVLELREGIFIEVPELLVHLLLTELQVGVRIEVVTSALLHAIVDKHPLDQQGGAGGRVLVLPGTPTRNQM